MMHAAIAAPARSVLSALTLFAAVGSYLSLERPAAAESTESAVANVNGLNQRAVERYRARQYPDARQLLKQALRICTTSGLERDPVKARTHANLGVILLGGFHDRKLAVEHFRQALEIQPDVSITAALMTPEIAEAFSEAASSGTSPGAATAPTRAVADNEEPAGPTAATRKPSAPTKHGGPSAAAPTPAPAAEPDAPPSAEAESSDAGPSRLGTMPFSEPAPSESPPSRSESADKAGSSQRRWHVYFNFSAGVGAGYVVGKTETLKMKTNSGTGVAEDYHIAPELGVYVSDTFFLSAMLRYQMISAVNVVETTDGTALAKDAAAGFLKLTWVARRLGFRPYFNLAVGGGTIRHVVKFDQYFACGPNRNASCIDNVAASGFMVGPGFGFFIDLGKNLAITASAQGLLILGSERQTVNADGTLGLALSL